MREDFDGLRPPAEFVALFPPVPDELFASLRSQVTDEMLKVVAACDYGEDADAHFAALQQIRSGADVGATLNWVPNEVLCLYRWSEARDDRDFLDPAKFHLTRAFCCAALLSCPDIHENRDNFGNESLGPLVESCLELGEPYVLGVLSYLTWSLQTMEPWDEEYLFHGLSLVIAYASLESADARLVATCGEWFVRVSEEILPWHKEMHPRATHVLELEYRTVNKHVWHRLVCRLRSRIDARSEFGELVKSMCPTASHEKVASGEGDGPDKDLRPRFNLLTWLLRKELGD